MTANVSVWQQEKRTRKFRRPEGRHRGRRNCWPNTTRGGMEAVVHVVHWRESQLPDPEDLAQRLREEGYTPFTWIDSPGRVY